MVSETGWLRFIEVKGRIERNETLAALNKPDSFILALVQVPVNQDFSEGGCVQSGGMWWELSSSRGELYSALC
ncbi:MAG: hypothetical protein RMK91_01945 [Pseudanabaenaceae cyanobacterium SKYGB_i_bin29]|nr:DUF3883 domain-containing protein [Pseudanabaenaceae cyanobacterium SKYG29]MDW8420611.1 hypothetical protein [Pseudanabaenaceae cyanobacterium SKYGB_i_bin29]